MTEPCNKRIRTAPFSVRLARSAPSLQVLDVPVPVTAERRGRLSPMLRLQVASARRIGVTLGVTAACRGAPTYRYQWITSLVWFLPMESKSSSSAWPQVLAHMDRAVACRRRRDRHAYACVGGRRWPVGGGHPVRSAWGAGVGARDRAEAPGGGGSP